MTTKEILFSAKKASGDFATADTSVKNAMIVSMAEALTLASDEILTANQQDVDKSRGVISDVMLDRLTLTAKRIADMADGMRAIAQLPDPVWHTIETYERPNGLKIEKKAVPFGVIAIIYESRPNVTSDAVALAVKSGNACVLRCGKEAHATCSAIMNALKKGIVKAGGNPDVVWLVEDTTRAGATELMTATGLVDLLIPRGGAGLIASCVQNATVPCIQTGTGICHVYVDDEADLQKALNIIVNAKTSRPSVCNAAEVCLVHEKVAPLFLPLLQKALVQDRIKEGKIPVELRLCPRASECIEGTLANDKDFDTEFLDYVMSVKVISSVEEAVTHIVQHSTGHSEVIVTENSAHADWFLRKVDSAAVYVNASTRFTDGGEFGFGCEMGISTQKLHARGPMGLNELTTYKYVIIGDGQIR